MGQNGVAKSASSLSGCACSSRVKPSEAGVLRSSAKQSPRSAPVLQDDLVPGPIDAPEDEADRELNLQAVVEDSESCEVVDGALRRECAEAVSFSAANSTELISAGSSAKPCFAGRWLVHRTEGDFNAFLIDMGQSWVIRTAARTLNYGLGRVQVRCEQISHNEFKFAKILTDPTMRESHIHVRVGEVELHFKDDIGRLTATSRWESDKVLRFDATADATSLPLTLLMYLTSEGEFVEEMISGRGTSVKYIFASQN